MNLKEVDACGRQEWFNIYHVISRSSETIYIMFKIAIYLYS